MCRPKLRRVTYKLNLSLSRGVGGWLRFVIVALFYYLLCIETKSPVSQIARNKHNLLMIGTGIFAGMKMLYILPDCPIILHSTIR